MRFLFFLSTIFFFVSCETNSTIIGNIDRQLNLENGVLYHRDKPFSGILVDEYEKGALKLKVAYRDGRKEGLETKWYANGQKAEERYYKAGVKIKNHLGWWENGSKKFEYHFNEKGFYDGNRKEWFQNGQLMFDLNYELGKEVGSQRMWNADGKMRANYIVVDGERFGLVGFKKCYSVTINENGLN